MKPEERKIVQELLEYFKLARTSHANLRMMLEGEAGDKHVIQPLKRLAEWENKKESKFVKVASLALASGAVGLAAWKAYKTHKEAAGKEEGAKE